MPPLDPAVARAAVAAAALSVARILDELAARNDEPSDLPRAYLHCLVRWGRGERVTNELKRCARSVTAWAHGGAGRRGALGGREVVRHPVSRPVYLACGALRRMRAIASGQWHVSDAMRDRALEATAQAYADLSGDPLDAATARVRRWYELHLAEELGDGFTRGS